MGWTSKNIVMDEEGDAMLDKRTDEVLDPEVDSTYQKDKFQAKFIVYKDYKIVCRMVGEIDILNGIDTLGA